MATDKQIDANRRNGKKGGPKTPAGRAAVRNNALKHGLSAQHPVIPGLEKQSDFDKYLNLLRQELQPAGIMEHMLVDQIADAYWRRQRIIQMETGMFEINRSEREKYTGENLQSLDAGAVLHHLAKYDADALARYYRYDALFERSFFKAWKELKSLQAARQSAPQPEAEVIETEEPEPQPTEFAKQTQIEPGQPAPTPNRGPGPPQKAENDDSTM
jgi:hypothetical protein